MLREFFAHRDLLHLLVLREVRIRYARATLGVVWALFLPVAMMGVFVLLNFGRLLPAGGGYDPGDYPLYAFCGILPWTHFASSLPQATPSLAASRDLLRKSAFPREFIPMARPLAALLDLAIGAVFLGILLVAFGVPPAPSMLAVPVVFALQFAFTSGLALLLSAGNLFYRDVQYLLQAAILLGMFVTSVLYPVAIARPGVAGLLALNPMTSYLDSYREALLLGRWPTATLVPGLVGAAASLLLGTAVFRRLSPRCAEEA